MNTLKRIIVVFALSLCLPAVLQAQENDTNKPPASFNVIQTHNLPTPSLNLGAQRLKEIVVYQIDENTRFGMSNGISLGFKINF